MRFQKINVTKQRTVIRFLYCRQKTDRQTVERVANAGDTVNFKFHNSESSYGIMEKRNL